jgi:hypothetical protein
MRRFTHSVIGSAFLLAAVALVTPNGITAAGSAPIEVIKPLPLPVSVTNSAPLQVLDATTRQPFQRTLCTGPGPIFFSCVGSSSFTVPADKALVIEYLSGTCATGGVSETMMWASVSTTAGGTAGSHVVVPHFTVTTTNPNGTFHFYSFGQETRVYADPGTEVTARAGSFPADNVSCWTFVSGHLDD